MVLLVEDESFEQEDILCGSPTTKIVDNAQLQIQRPDVLMEHYLRKKETDRISSQKRRAAEKI